jgi:hypothetical protein
MVLKFTFILECLCIFTGQGLRHGTLDQLRSQAADTNDVVTLPAVTSLVQKSSVPTKFQNQWLQALKANSSLSGKLCDADKLVNISCHNREYGMDYSSNCMEFCRKLAGVMKNKDNVVGTFPRCAARINEESAKAFANPDSTADYGCLVTPFSPNGFLKYWEMYQKGEVILVMGQGLNPDGTAPPTLKRRAEKAAELFRERQIPVIVSGGDDRATGKTEAMGLAEVMNSEGVPFEAILYEGQATSSLENFWFGFRQIRRYMHPKNNKVKIMLVTSDWHMPRSSYMGKVVAHYFKNSEKREGVPNFFEKFDIEIEEVPVKSYCSQDPSAKQGDFMGSNTNSLVKKCSDEYNALKNHIHGPERLSVGQESLDNNVWGVSLDPLISILESHRAWIERLKKWSLENKCSGIPDTEAEEAITPPDDLLNSDDDLVRSRNEKGSKKGATHMMP